MVGGCANFSRNGGAGGTLRNQIKPRNKRRSMYTLNIKISRNLALLMKDQYNSRSVKQE